MAICSIVTPASRLRATRTTSSRNSLGKGLGTVTSFQPTHSGNPELRCHLFVQQTQPVLSPEWGGPGSRRYVFPMLAVCDCSPISLSAGFVSGAFKPDEALVASVQAELISAYKGPEAVSDGERLTVLKLDLPLGMPVVLGYSEASPKSATLLCQSRS